MKLRHPLNPVLRLGLVVAGIALAYTPKATLLTGVRAGAVLATPPTGAGVSSQEPDSPQAGLSAEVVLKLPQEVKDALSKISPLLYYSGVRDGAIVAAIVLLVLYALSNNRRSD